MPATQAELEADASKLVLQHKDLVGEEIRISSIRPISEAKYRHFVVVWDTGNPAIHGTSIVSYPDGDINNGRYFSTEADFINQHLIKRLEEHEQQQQLQAAKRPSLSARLTSDPKLFLSGVVAIIVILGTILWVSTRTEIPPWWQGVVTAVIGFFFGATTPGSSPKAD